MMSHMKKLIAYTFVLIALIMPATASADTEIERLSQQVTAIANYVEELVGHIEVARGTYSPAQFSEAERAKIIADGSTFLKKAQEENGHFAYEYRPYEDAYTDDDNIVRQAGTFYQLAEVAVHDTEDVNELEETLQRSISYFEDLSPTDTFEDRTFRCIVNGESSDDCKLGATSLALVGVLDVMERYPEHEDTYRSLAEDYMSFILAMKKNNGGFRNLYTVGENIQSAKESSFSNGEAMLALVRYYKYEQSDEIKEVLLEMFDYINSEEVPFDSALYLWAMAALIDMQELWPNDAHLDYAEEYTDWRIDGFSRRKNTMHNMCAYVEGVVLAHVLLEGTLDESGKQSLQREIDFWLARMARLQIDETDRVRIITDEEGVRFGEITDMSLAFGGFLTGEDELKQRIDFTQHCLNAYLLAP